MASLNLDKSEGRWRRRRRRDPLTVVLCEIYAVSGPSSPPPSRLFLKFESGEIDAVRPPFCNWTQYFCARGLAVCVTVLTPSSVRRHRQLVRLRVARDQWE